MSIQAGYVFADKSSYITPDIRRNGHRGRGCPALATQGVDGRLVLQRLDTSEQTLQSRPGHGNERSDIWVLFGRELVVVTATTSATQGIFQGVEHVDDAVGA
jgi:hypothetical protein